MKQERNSPCECGSGKKYKHCCLLSVTAPKITHGLNYISADSYFIRLKDNKDWFIHFEGDNPENPKQEVIYRVKEGAKGAGVFHKEQGSNFIIMEGADNLELVKVTDVLGNDGTLN